jgi:hypothetical protein
MPKNVNASTHLRNLTDGDAGDAVTDDTVRMALPRIVPDVIDAVSGEARIQVIDRCAPPGRPREGRERAPLPLRSSSGARR